MIDLAVFFRRWIVNITVNAAACFTLECLMQTCFFHLCRVLCVDKLHVVAWQQNVHQLSSCFTISTAATLFSRRSSYTSTLLPLQRDTYYARQQNTVLNPKPHNRGVALVTLQTVFWSSDPQDIGRNSVTCQVANVHLDLFTHVANILARSTSLTSRGNTKMVCWHRVSVGIFATISFFG